MSLKNTVVPFGARRGDRLRLNIAPQPPVTRAREPVRPTAGKVVGFFPSAKNNRQIAWESQLEKRACLLFEFSSGVLSYREQPITIFYPCEGKMRKYTPDFELLLTTKQRVFVEVKPASKLKDQELIKRLRNISAFWMQHDCHFIVITDEELNQPVRQHNLSFLRPHLKPACNRELVDAATKWLLQNQDATVQGLSEFTGSLNKVYSLIAQGHIAIDLDKPISLETQLSTLKDINDETCLFTYRTAPDFERRSIHCESNS
ncbi:hypothetical protein FT643_19025 [Ketobacter sp. MCCC 1A13808]|uniref:TnsA endonuclease N-terminal domain-containing protein n=1 Tax=Ketobacter sp. MCCC 1A13808 TaxID=2602738 RepID=UPI0012EBDD56|nr:TnsA endonuclease N-terminal domain-containing protein [Ketobacter sp. MCCC 1A13808]MVF14233.1 hypothetical protein [Ketobacter sp. MCCC 1A13808]